MAEKTSALEDLQNPTTAWEPRDIHPFGVVITALVVLFGGLLLTGLLWFYFEFLKHERAEASQPLPRAAHYNPIPPAPRPEATPAHDLAAYQAAQQYFLHHYSWVDRQKGTVAIPIDAAIDIAIKRGLPPQPPASSLNLPVPVRGSEQTGLEGSVIRPQQ